ncbi:MAG: class I SAM-dependent methyltransferase [Spirochaetales bacterium]|nr:MAG: class I SAM-dependent methyltransferase [Spirochaetales bacterium]
MSFYERLSRYYDDVFPFSTDVFAMLTASFPAGASVLDIACGTGTYSIPLAEAGYAVTAFDSDPVMVEKARQKAGQPAGGLNFYVSTMEDMPDLPGKPFDGIFCIGNSLVHLPDTEAVAAFLGHSRRLLKPGGTAVIQIINYDRIITKNLTGLPSLTAPGVVFERNYRLSGDSSTVMFHTRLVITRKEKPEILEQEIPLLALRTAELTGMLEEAGFRDMNLFGSFSGSTFDRENSMPFIVRAKA